MEAAEVPVIEEHGSPPPEMEAGGAMVETPVGTPPSASLALALPPSTAEAVEGKAGVGGLEAEDSSPTHSDWELLSVGHHSHCGSSPRSVSASEAYDSDGEAAQSVEAPVEADAPLAAAEAGPQAVVDAAAEVEASKAVEQGVAAAAAAAADEGAIAEAEAEAEHAAEAEAEPLPQLLAALAEAEEGLMPAGGEGQVAEALGTETDSPRSSYERPSSRASRHDLYSVSQDGSVQSLSDENVYIGNMMLQAEPSHASSSAANAAAHPAVAHSGSSSEDEGLGPAGNDDSDKPQRAELPLLACTPVAALAASVHAAHCAVSHQLHQLAASVSAMLERMAPAVADVAQHVMRGVASMFDSLRERMAALPQDLASLAEAVHPAAGAAVHRADLAAQRVRKQLGFKKINWAIMLLGVTCGGLAVALYRSHQEQARMQLLLARREADLSRLLSKVMELQRNITQRRHPLLRHVAAAPPTPFWPAVVVV